MFTNIDVVLFDLDGTLIDSAPDLGAAVDRMRVKRGMTSLPLDNYRPMAGAGARGMLQIGFDMTPAHTDFAAMREEFFQEYERDLTANTVFFDEVADMLKAIEAAGMKWGVVTNKSERFTMPIARQMPMLANAATVISGDTTAHAKPHPAPLLEAAKRVGVHPQRCVYVGDDERDIVAGLAAGMHTVAAVYGYLGANSGIASWGSHASISKPSHLLRLLNM